MTSSSEEPGAPHQPPAYPQQPPAYPPPPAYQPPAYPQQPYPPQQYGYPPAVYPAYPPQYAYAGYGHPVAPLSGLARGLGWAVVGQGLLTAVSAFLPWATVFGLSVNGIGGEDVGGVKDGVITLPLGILAACLGLGRALARKPGVGQLVIPVLTLVVGGLIALIGVVDLADLPTGVSAGAGLVLTLLAGLGIAGTSVGAILKRT